MKRSTGKAFQLDSTHMGPLCDGKGDREGDRERGDLRSMRVGCNDWWYAHHDDDDDDPGWPTIPRTHPTNAAKARLGKA